MDENYTKSPWNSVNDRLPELHYFASTTKRSGPVLIAYKHKLYVKYRTAVARVTLMENSKNISWCGDEIGYDDVVYWMYIPEVPNQ